MTRIRGRAARGLGVAGLLLAVALAVSVSAASGYEGEEEGEHAASAPKLWKILQQEQSAPAPEVLTAVRHDTSKALRDIAPVFPGAMQEAPENPARQVAPVKMPDFFDPTLQTVGPKTAMQPPNASFEGVNNVNFVLPPDTNGDVSATQYVQTVNLSFAVYSKTGTKLYGPAATNTLFSNFGGGACQTTNDGDPIVQYDQLANRWLITQFALPNFPNGPFYQCIAVSTTSDATSSWYRYQFQISTTRMNDYPKFGVWPDGYYASFNDFNAGSLSFAGATVVAFQRDKMLLGQPALGVKFVLGPQFYSMLPSDLDGTALPPAGAPNAFVQMDDNVYGYPQDQLEVWKFDVDFATPANSTFTSDATPATSSFDSILANIPQPNTAARLDTLSDRLMYRLAYRNFGTYEAMVVNQSVDVGSDRAGLRWYELRRTGGSWSIFQQGTYAPADGLNRWMGSVAQDKFGNMAGGWSVSSSAMFPSIFYGGRLSTDPAGTLGSESTLFSGTGSQTSGSQRWGDYSSISVDPVDDCTFWFTTEYVQTTGNAPWRTRIASFRFPACGPGGAGTPTITSFSPPSGPIGTSVTISGTNFTGATAVTFNFAGATYTVNNSTQITATVPAGATSGHIRVTTPGGTATSPTWFIVNAGGGTPTITSFSPPNGPVGTLVTINGTNFTGASSVSFNFTNAAYTVDTPTKITATVPAGATSGHIRVTTPGGTAASATNFFVP